MYYGRDVCGPSNQPPTPVTPPAEPVSGALTSKTLERRGCSGSLGVGRRPLSCLDLNAPNGRIPSAAPPPAKVKRPPPKKTGSDAAGIKEGTRARPGQWFFITVPVHIGPSLKDKEVCKIDFIETISFILPLLQYCVCIEEYSNSEVYTHHLHCLIQLEEPMLIVEVNEYIKSLFGLEQFDNQSPRDYKKVCRYISKNEQKPYTNMSMKYMSFYCQSFYYLTKMTNFQFTHPFVVEHWNKYNFLMKMFNEIKSSMNPKFSWVYPDIRYDVCWAREVYDWWDNFVSTTYYYKKLHLYLYGDSNIGKSTLIRSLLYGLGDRVYYGSTTDAKYFLDCYNSFYKVIVLEEFDLSQYNYEQFKSLLSGEPVNINRKFFDQRVIQNVNPIIMISNYPPRNDPTFLNRVRVVNADWPLFQDSITTDEEPITKPVIDGVSEEEDLSS